VTVATQQFPTKNLTAAKKDQSFAVRPPLRHESRALSLALAIGCLPSGNSGALRSHARQETAQGVGCRLASSDSWQCAAQRPGWPGNGRAPPHTPPDGRREGV
jgi:hypothetical protein